MSQETLVLFCSCSYYQLVSQRDKQIILESIKACGLNHEAVGDLCGLAAKHDPVLKTWAQHDSLKIVACYPRAIKCLFERADAPLDIQKVEFFNMRSDEPRAIIQALLGDSDKSFKAGADESSPITDISKTNGAVSDEWIPWFPVIDYDRCVNCKQCLNFCLFGTFQLDDQSKVWVENPSHCKTNCPACARVCPQKAIIFPKYGDSPINGDEVMETEVSAEGIKSLTEGDIYEMLRSRSRGRRFSADVGESTTTDVISNLQKGLDIPSDVIKSLSADDMAQINKKMRECDDQ